MSASTLVRTIIVSNSIAGAFKFEIYQDEDAHFFADIYRKNSDGIWVLGWDEYGFQHALDVDEATASCTKFVDNLVIDAQSRPIL